MIEEHDRIILQADSPDDGLFAGDIGTVISVHGAGAAYTVEFMTLTGNTIAVTTIPATNVRAISQNNMQQGRQLQKVA